MAAAIDAAGWDERGDDEVLDDYEALIRQAVALRFRSDVPVGIAISGGLDSSTLLALVDATGPDEAGVHAFTFTTGDPAYDELPWVEALVAGTAHPLHSCRLRWVEVPELAERIQAVSDGPFGGIPTLAYARLFERARAVGVTVVLDGQGMDEQWAGYDYYRGLGDEGEGAAGDDSPAPPIIQGTTSSPTRAACIGADLLPLVASSTATATATVTAGEAGDPAGGAVSRDRLVAAQLQDLTAVKLPRALRFNDRASMASSCELREPFLDHRVVELALRQPRRRKVDGATGKVLLRRLADERLGARDVAAPKRPVQTPARMAPRAVEGLGPRRGGRRHGMATGVAVAHPGPPRARPVRRRRGRQRLLRVAVGQPGPDGAHAAPPPMTPCPR